MLVERHASEMYRLAAAIVGAADARDIVQDAFVTGWQRLPQLRDADAFGPWLRRICANSARNCLRSRARRGSPMSLEGAGHAAGRATHPARDFRFVVEARSILEPAFESLSPDQRAVLALHYSMEYTIRETADALGIRVGTAKSRLNAGLAVLRGRIGEPAEPSPEAAR